MTPFWNLPTNFFIAGMRSDHVHNTYVPLLLHNECGVISLKNPFLSYIISATPRFEPQRTRHNSQLVDSHVTSVFGRAWSLDIEKRVAEIQ
jgi:hypothetical protein